jgi:hypothetical protein
MSTHQIDAMIEVNAKFALAGKEAVEILQGGDAVDVIVQKRVDTKPRSVPQNKLIYAIYKRIGDTLYGGDELHARRECKLMIGCKILYLESEKFVETFDKVIRPLPQEIRLEAMDLISVSSIMTVKQCKQFITDCMNQYTLRQVYFSDIEGTEEYSNYKQAQQW